MQKQVSTPTAEQARRLMDEWLAAVGYDEEPDEKRFMAEDVNPDDDNEEDESPA